MFKIYNKALFLVCATLLHILFFKSCLAVLPAESFVRKEISFIYYLYIPPERIVKTDDSTISQVCKEEDAQSHVESGHKNQPDNNNTVNGIKLFAAAPEYQKQDGEPETCKANKPETSQGSRVLLSDQGFIRAVSRLSWKDRVWLVKLLSRCSFAQFIQIKDMLKDGITWEENRAMFLMLKDKITEEEQQKLDNLIEIYSKKQKLLLNYLKPLCII